MKDGGKYKIFLISDHCLAPSGVATSGLWLARFLLGSGRYRIFQFGGAIKHASYNPIKVDPYGDDFVIVPVDGFGSKMQIRQALATEKPDAMLLFTDPRFFIHIFEMEDEIHDVCPISYWNIWDNYPVPKYNSVLYDSCDLLNCINKVAYNSICSMGFKDKTNFVGHALLPGMYFPLSKDEKLKQRAAIFGKDRANYFMVVWVNRNARRKQPGDLLMGWKLFLEKLQKDEGHMRAILTLHTNPQDLEGPALFSMIDELGLHQNIFISRGKLDTPQMNVLYNTADWTINVASAEGFSLSILEGKSVGIPPIAHTTGGMTHQIINDINGEEFGIPLKTDTKCLVGSQQVPYIYDDYVNWETIANGLWKAYKTPKDQYEKLSERCIEDVNERFSYEAMGKAWDESLTKVIEEYRANKNKPRFVKITI